MKLKYKQLAQLFILTGALAIPSAMASESPIYDYVSAYYQVLEVDESETGIDAEPDGFGIEFSRQFSNSMYFVASYDNLSGDYQVTTFTFDSDVSVLTAGVGFKYSASRETDLFFEPALVYADSDFGNSSENDTGFAAKLGFTHVINQAFHLKGFLRHVNVFDDNTNSYGLEGRIFFNDQVQGILGAEANSDEKLFRAGFSYRF